MGIAAGTLKNLTVHQCPLMYGEQDNLSEVALVSQLPSPPVSGGLPAGAAQQLQHLQQWCVRVFVCVCV